MSGLIIAVRRFVNHLSMLATQVNSAWPYLRGMHSEYCWKHFSKQAHCTMH